MRTLGIRIKENTHYAPYDDECWIVLAKEIMASYADRYSYQVPTNAFSQSEYNLIDHKTYLPVRKSILRNVQNGPLKNVADMPSVYRAFEQRRLEYKQSLGIRWKDTEYDGLF